jgi:sortase A
MRKYSLEIILFIALVSFLLSTSEGPDDLMALRLPPSPIIETVIHPPSEVIKKIQKDSAPLENIVRDSLGNLIDWIPKRIKVARVGIDAAIEQVGVLPNGAMDVPKDDWRVGWLNSGYLPGEKGSAVMAGHVDNLQGVAVFHPLHDMKRGDQVEVTRSDGSVLTFVVIDTQVYRTEKAPIQQIFGPSSRARLNLITCTGYFDPKRRTHIDRLVVYTELHEEKRIAK